MPNQIFIATVLGLLIFCDFSCRFCAARCTSRSFACFTCVTRNHMAMSWFTAQNLCFRRHTKIVSDVTVLKHPGLVAKLCAGYGQSVAVWTGFLEYKNAWMSEDGQIVPTSAFGPDDVISDDSAASHISPYEEDVGTEEGVRRHPLQCGYVLNDRLRTAPCDDVAGHLVSYALCVRYSERCAVKSIAVMDCKARSNRKIQFQCLEQPNATAHGHSQCPKAVTSTPIACPDEILKDGCYKKPLNLGWFYYTVVITLGLTTILLGLISCGCLLSGFFKLQKSSGVAKRAASEGGEPGAQNRAKVFLQKS